MTAFLALLRRDLYVTGRNAAFLLTGTLTQPILVVLVFGNILPRLHLVADEFRTVMLPGLMSISILMAGVQGVLMPLSIDAPRRGERGPPELGVAAPPRDPHGAHVGVVRPHPGHEHPAALHRPPLRRRDRPHDDVRLRVLPLASLTVLGPFQYLFLLNPLVFMSEGMRYAVTPEVPHMPLALLLVGLVGFTALLTLAGAKAFEKRTIL